MASYQIIREPAAMQAFAEAARARGQRLAVVPTMGYLHEGHLSLLREARRRADVVILTIFVNPTQFGANEDLSRYPRDEAGDLAKAASCGLDIAFCPDATAMYPAGSQTFVTVRELQVPMCGVTRPEHFTGVATVVAKLFNLTRPHVALFGEKDFQQLAVIRRMAADLNFNVEVAGMPIVREPDGLAMSSRNVYLTPAQRIVAISLSQGLRAAQARYAAGERDAAALRAAALAPMAAHGAALTLDYLDVRDAATLAAVDVVAGPTVIAVAAFVGATRLIDNIVLA
ncbi:MAG: pantoate--beta-alanine ligase [Myxococcales bacterium]|nr:pantoate--beta-alanine ligase [Myxococcales bacterium]